jgi:hypothetical protein
MPTNPGYRIPEMKAIYMKLYYQQNREYILKEQKKYIQNKRKSVQRQESKSPYIIYDADPLPNVSEVQVSPGTDSEPGIPDIQTPQ